MIVGYNLTGQRRMFLAGLWGSLLLVVLAGAGLLLLRDRGGAAGVLALAVAAFGASLGLAVVCLTSLAIIDRFGGHAALYRLAFRTSPDAMVLTRLSDGKYVEVNRSFAELSGYSRRELMGRSASQTGIWVDPGVRERILRELLRGGQVRDVEADFRCKDGRVRHGLVSAAAMRIGGQQHVLSVVRDITARKEAEARLRQTMDQLVATNTELMRFAHTAAHDLQEPLRSIVSYSQLLVRHADGTLSPEMQEDLNYLIPAARRMHGLINGLLNYTRLSTSSRPLRPVDTRHVVTAAVDGLRETLDEAGAEVTVGALPVVRGDELQILQVIQNLLSNAVKFRAPDRPCRIHLGAAPDPIIPARAAAEVPDGFAVFGVSDNGIGIPEGHRDRVFQIFHRLHTPQEYPGTGVGLSMCRRIIEGHGGRIWIVPAAEGGTTVLFTLPLDAGRDEVSDPAAEPGVIL